MPLCPPLYVEPPAVTPYGYGLYSVATMPVPEENPHWRCGVHYEPWKCGRSFLWADPCDNPDQPDKMPADGVDLVEGTPFLVWDGYHCRLPGRSNEAEVRRRATEALRLGEQRSVEEAFWTGSMGNSPALADPSTVVLNPNNPPAVPADVLTFPAGVAALEEWLGNNYPGQGTIFASRGASAYFARHQLGFRVGGHVETLAGTRVAFLGGSPNTGPDGTPAPAGYAWLYATGQVVIRRSEIFVNPDTLAAALNRSTNEVLVLAEREIVITRECGTAAVLVDISC